MSAEPIAQGLEIGPQGVSEPFKAQGSRRVVGGEIVPSLSLKELASAVSQFVQAQYGLHGWQTQEDHDLGIDQFQLLLPVGATGSQFIPTRVAVVRRTALDHVADEHLLAGEADACQQLL